MGSYTNRKNKKNIHSTLISGSIVLSIGALLLIGIIILPSFFVSKIILAVFGIMSYPLLVLAMLVGIALMLGKRFSMSTKNVVLLTILTVFLVALFHTIFSTDTLKSFDKTNFTHYGDYIKECFGSPQLPTVGGVIMAILVYPFIAVFGIVGTYVVFSIGIVIVGSITLDYYINVKSIYDNSVTRRDNYARNIDNTAGFVPSMDTIGQNLSALNSANDVVPTKINDKDYIGYFNYDEKLSPTPDADELNSNIDTDTSEPIEEYPQEPEKTPSQNAINILYGKGKFEGFETSKIVNDEKAKETYDPSKFSSLDEYIKTKYVPKQFINNNEDSTNNEDSISPSSYRASTISLDEDSFAGKSFVQSTNSKNSPDYDDDNDDQMEEQDEPNKSLPHDDPFAFSDLGDTIDNESTNFESYGRERRGRGPDLSPRKSADRSRSDYFASPFSSAIGNNGRDSERQRSRVAPESSQDDSNSNNRTNGNDSYVPTTPSYFDLKPKAVPEQTTLPIDLSKPKFHGGLEADAKYNAPPLSLLAVHSDDVSSYGGDYKKKSEDLEKVLSSFKIDAKVDAVTRGPSVTQYELTMPLGISVKRVLAYDSDIAAALRSKSGVRIEAPIFGKNAVGVEVPNDKRSKVGLRELLESKEFSTSTAALPVVIGKNISGEVIVKSLPKMVHVLVAGSTGSGKSIFLHSLILSLMYKCSPRQLRFILIDPKRVEFTHYSGMPHMMLPNAVSDCDKAINALGWAVKEMERRYKFLEQYKKQNIEDFNHCDAVKSNKEDFLPYIVIIIDELADLMMVGKRDVEEKIMRISQLGRACGIHIVIATQRPSTDIITGTIKNNLPTRIAFSLGSYVDSRTILDESGAEKLLGAGDMLLSAHDSNVTIRLQAGFMTMDEVRRIIEYIKENNESYFDEEVAKAILTDKKEEVSVDGEPNNGNENDFDELMPQALRLVIETGGASINMVQRRFRVGYARAARIIDQMELAGFVSPGNGSKLRSVYITLDQFHEMFGEDN